jgi:hypothetical protein
MMSKLRFFSAAIAAFVIVAFSAAQVQAIIVADGVVGAGEYAAADMVLGPATYTEGVTGNSEVHTVTWTGAARKDRFNLLYENTFGTELLLGPAGAAQFVGLNYRRERSAGVPFGAPDRWFASFFPQGSNGLSFMRLHSGGPNTNNTAVYNNISNFSLKANHPGYAAEAGFGTGNAVYELQVPYSSPDFNGDGIGDGYFDGINADSDATNAWAANPAVGSKIYLGNNNGGSAGPGRLPAGFGFSRTTWNDDPVNGAGQTRGEMVIMPEPATLALFGIGLGLTVLSRRRR